METKQLENLCQWKRRQGTCLSEVDDLTGQLAEALGRGDQVSVKMLLTMREDPIKQADELERTARSYLLSLPEEDAGRLKELLDGAPAEAEAERPLAQQTAKNYQTLKKIQEVDRRLSLQLGGRHSFYRKFRD